MDTLVGGFGPDILKGNNGRDSLRGRQGADVYKGGRGNDTLQTLDGESGHGDLLRRGQRETCCAPTRTIRSRSAARSAVASPRSTSSFR